jgi:hypothetical protein
MGLMQSSCRAVALAPRVKDLLFQPLPPCNQKEMRFTYKKRRINFNLTTQLDLRGFDSCGYFPHNAPIFSFFEGYG